MKTIKKTHWNSNAIATFLVVCSLLLGLSASAQTIYYSKSTGDLTDLTTWGLNTDGSGSNPANFTTANHQYRIVNRTLDSIISNWTVSGTNSRIVVGDGLTPTEFVIPSGVSVNATINVTAVCSLTLRNNTSPTMGTLNASSTVSYAGVGAQTINTGTYGTLVIANDRGGNNITFSGIVAAQNFNLNSTNVGNYITTGSTITYNKPTGGQTIYSVISYNNLTISNTSGIQTADGAITVGATLALSNAAVLDMGVNTLAATTVTLGNGSSTIRTQNTSATPIPAVNYTNGVINYNAATGGQTIVPTTYARLTLGNTSGNQTAGGDITVNTLLTTTAGGAFDLGNNRLLGTLSTITNGGTIKTSNTSTTPLTTGKTWTGGTIHYNANGAQTIVAGTYTGTLLISEDRSGQDITFESGNISVSGTLSLTATSVGNYITTGNRINYSATAGGKRVYSIIPYNKLTIGNTSGIDTADGNITVIDSFVTTSGGTFFLDTFNLSGTLNTIINNGAITTNSTNTAAIPSGRNWTGTTGLVTFANPTGGQFIPEGFYKSLTQSNSTGTNTAIGNIDISTALRVTSANGTLSMDTLLLTGAFTSTVTGTLATKNTSATPYPTGKTWGGTIVYNNTSEGQTIPQGTYARVSIENGTDTTIAGGILSISTLLNVTSGSVLKMGSFAISGALTTITNNGTITSENTSATPFPTGKTWNGTGNVVLDKIDGGQTLVFGTYNNNIILNNTSGTNTTASLITANAGLTTTAGGTLAFPAATYSLIGTVTPNNNGTITTECTSNPALPSGKTWGGTIIYTRASGGQFIPSGTYNNLMVSNTAGTVTATGAVNVNGTLTTTSGGLLSMAANQLGGIPTSIVNNGTISTTCTLNPAIPSGQNWTGTTGTVIMGSTTGRQYIPEGTYKNLTCSHTSGSDTVLGNIEVTTALAANAGGTLDLVNSILTGSFTQSGTGTIRTINTSATPLPNNRVWTGTVNYANATGNQTVVSGTYNALTSSNTSNANTANGDIVVNTTLTLSNATSVLDMVNNLLTGSFNTSGTGKLQTQNTTATPIPSGKTWNGTVEYNNLSGGQSIVAGTYTGLINGNNTDTNTATGNIIITTALTTISGGTLKMGTNTLSGAFSTITNNGIITTENTSGSALPASKTWGGSGSIVYNASNGGQTIASGTYNSNLIINNTSGIDTVNGAIIANGNFTTASGGTLQFKNIAHSLSGSFTANHNGTLQTICTINPAIAPNKTWGGNVEFTRLTGGQRIPAGIFNNLTVLNTSGTNSVVGTPLQVDGTLTTTAGGTLNMLNNQLTGALTSTTHNGILTTICTLNPAIPDGKTWSGTVGRVIYALSTGNQFVAGGTYKTLYLTNTSDTNTVTSNLNVTDTISANGGANGYLDLQTNQLLGSFNHTGGGFIRTQNTSSNPVPNAKSWAGTVLYDATLGGQTIASGTYTNLRINHSTPSTSLPNGNLVISTGLFVGTNDTLDVNTNTVTGAYSSITNNGVIVTRNTSATPLGSGKNWGTNGTVLYANSSGSQTILTGTYNVLIAGNSTGVDSTTGPITVGNNFTTTSGGTVTFSGVNHSLSGTFTANNNGTLITFCTVNPAIPSGNSWGSTVIFNRSNGGQSIPAGTYNNLTSGNTTGTNTAVGSLIINGQLVTTSAGTLAMGFNQLSGSLASLTNNGIISTSCTVNPAIPSGYNWSGTTGRVIYGATGGLQFLPEGTYKSLYLANTTNTNTATGAITVTDTLSSTGGASGILNMSTNVLSGSFVYAGLGTLRTQAIGSSPIPSSRTWTGTVLYDGTSSQTIVNGTYTNIGLSGDKAGGNITLENGTISISGNFSVTATNIGGYSVGTNTCSYTTTSAARVGGINYNNLVFANTSGTKTADRPVGVAGALTTTSGGTFSLSTYKLTGSISSLTNNGTIATACIDSAAIPSGRTWTGTTGGVIFNSTTGGQFLPAGTYRILSFTNTSGENTVLAPFTTNTITVSGSINGTLNMGSEALNTTTITNSSSSFRTQNTSSLPFPSGLNLSSLSIQFDNATGGQTIPNCTVNNLICGNTTGTLTATGNVRINNNFTSGPNGTVIDMSTFTLGHFGSSFAITGGGTIRTRSTSTTAIQPNKNWPQLIEFYRSNGGQTIANGNFNGGLMISNTSGTIVAAAGSTINIGGDLTLSSGCLFSDNNTTITLTGNVVGTGTHSVSATGKIILTGSNKTISGATLGNITLNNSSGFSLSGSPTVQGTLNLAAGILNIDTNNITLGSSSVLAGSFDNTKMINANSSGMVRRVYSSSGSFTFPIGDSSTFTPITITGIGGTYGPTSTFSVNLKDTKHPNNANTNNYLNRHWNISVANISSPTYSLQATYNNSDIVGYGSGILSATYNGALPWSFHNALDTVTNSLSASGLSANNISISGLSGTIPTVNINSTAYAFCSGNSVNMTANATTDTPFTYVWAPATGLSTTTGNNVTVTLTTVGTPNTIVYTVTVTDGNGLTAVDTISITVNPLPTAISGSTWFCAGTSSTLSSSPAGGTWSSSNTFVAVVDTGGVVNGVIGGNATIYYTLASGCMRTVNITVGNLPEAMYGPATVCEGSSVTVSSYSPGYTWSSSNTAVATVNATTGSVYGVSDGVFTLTYTHPSTCSITRTMTVSPTPSVITGDSVLCLGSTSMLTIGDTLSGAVWSSSNLSVATVNSTTGLVSSVAGGTATISYRVPSSGCFATKQITVNTAIPNITGTFRTCIGQNTTLTHVSGGGIWSSSNTAVATVDGGGIVSGLTAGTSVITYTLGTGCFKTAVFTVNSNPAAIGGSSSVCIGATALQSCITPGLTSWTSSNPSVATIGATNGLVSGVSDGTVTITYTIFTGCYSTKELTVNPLPATITVPSFVCAGSNVSISSSIGGTWSTSNPTVASVNLSGDTLNAKVGGNVVITYTLPTGCRRVTTVTVGSLPAAITGTLTACPGGTGTLSSLTPGFSWSSSNSSVAGISVGGVVSAVSVGTTTISYTHTNGCFRTATFTVIGMPDTITGTSSFCLGSTSILSNTTPSGTWSTSNSGVIVINNLTGLATPLGVGTATISYRILGFGCVTTKTVTVSSTPAAITGTTLVCQGATTTLSHAVAGGSWMSSNAAIASVDNTTGVVTGVSLGSATITYYVSSGCYRTINVTVRSMPAAITGANEVCVGTTAVQACATTGGTWSSATPAIGTISGSAGVVGGVSSGTTTISYTITGSGCVSTKVVTVNPALALITGPTNVCVGNTIDLDHEAVGGVWSSSNVARATIDAGTGLVSGIANGGVNVTYTMPNGCFRAASIMVNP